MDWETFLLGTGYKTALDGPAPPPFNFSDDDYVAWAQHVVVAFVRKGGPYR